MLIVPHYSSTPQVIYLLFPHTKTRRLRNQVKVKRWRFVSSSHRCLITLSTAVSFSRCNTELWYRWRTEILKRQEDKVEIEKHHKLCGMETKKTSRENSPVVLNGRRSSSPRSPGQDPRPGSSSPPRCTSASPRSSTHSPVCSSSSNSISVSASASNSDNHMILSTPSTNRIHSTTTPIRPIPQIPHTVSKHILDRTTSPLSPLDSARRDLILKKPLMTSPHHHLHPHPSSSHHHPANGLLLPAHHHNNNNHKENNTPVLVPTRPSFMISDILGSSDKPRSRSPVASAGLNLSQRAETLNCGNPLMRHNSHTDSSVSPGSDYFRGAEKRKAPDDDDDDGSDLDVEESDCESSPDKGAWNSWRFAASLKHVNLFWSQFNNRATNDCQLLS